MGTGSELVIWLDVCLVSYSWNLSSGLVVRHKGLNSWSKVEGGLWEFRFEN